MGKSFIIPSIFTATDKYSAPLRNMIRNTEAFAAKAETAVNRSERAFRKLTPVLSEASKQFLSFASTAAIAGAIIGTANYSINALMDYESELANLQAVTGVTGKGFDVFKTKIQEVANTTHESAVQVAKAFTSIGNNQPELLKDADALAAVTKSSIILAQASKMQLEPAAQALTSILNQFGKGAKEAKETVDLLAAGSVIGSSEITDTANAIQKFGAIAANNGIKIVEAITAIETISGKIKGEEAGTQLKNFVAVMSAIKVQDPKAIADLHKYGVNMKVVADKTSPLIDRLRELSKIKNDTGALTHVFGKENLVVATSLLSSTEKYAELLSTIQTSEEAKNAADKMAAVNNATLAVAVQQVKNAFVNLITGNDKLTGGMKTLSNILLFVRDNMSDIIKWTIRITGLFLAWWAINKIIRISLIAYNIALGVYNGIMGISTVYTTAQTVAMAAQETVVGIMTAAQWLFNAALYACPLVWIIAAIAALIAIVVIAINKWNEWGAALMIFLGPLGMIISMVQAFRRNWDMITKSFREGGILSGIKAIGKTLLDFILMPLQQILHLVAKFTGFEWAKNAEASILKFRTDLGVNTTTDESGNPLPKEAVNTKSVQQDALIQKITQTNDARVDIHIKDPNNRTTASGFGDFLNIITTSTMPAYSR